MNKLLEFGRKAMFYVRVLSGYEERRIRSYRLQLQKRLQQAEERKVSLRKMPEQMILSQVRQMVEEMQALNKKLEETETAIDEYFKPLDKEAEIVMKMQLEGEEKAMREMMKTMQAQALLEKTEAGRLANVTNSEMVKTTQSQALLEKTEGERLANVTKSEANEHVQEKVPTSTTPAEVR